MPDTIEPADAFLLRSIATYFYCDEAGEVDGISAGTAENIGRLRALADLLEQSKHIPCMCDECYRARWRGEI